MHVSRRWRPDFPVDAVIDALYAAGCRARDIAVTFVDVLPNKTNSRLPYLQLRSRKGDRPAFEGIASALRRFDATGVYFDFEHRPTDRWLKDSKQESFYDVSTAVTTLDSIAAIATTLHDKIINEHTALQLGTHTTQATLTNLATSMRRATTEFGIQTQNLPEEDAVSQLFTAIQQQERH
ncbi:unnamed protein product [Fusarium graminearum]|nr:unnamed protein product [Fusarium graminearum]